MSNVAAEEARFGLIINGEDVSTKDTFEVLSPTKQTIVHKAPTATEEQAIQAVEDAETAFEEWRDSTPLERRTILLRAAHILEERKDELVAAMVQETGAKPSWAAFNIKTGLGFVHEAAGMTTQVKGEILQSNDKGMSTCPLCQAHAHCWTRHPRYGLQGTLWRCARHSTMECTYR